MCVHVRVLRAVRMRQSWNILELGGMMWTLPNTIGVFDVVDRFLDEALGAPSVDVAPVSHQHRGSSSFYSALDLVENADGTVTATVEVPGFRRGDLSIELHDDRLTISGEPEDVTTERPSDSTEQERQVVKAASSPYVIRERSYGKFSRSINLPQGTKPESITASVADGLLTVTFPKKTPETEPRRIQIA
ncbi:HSP20-like chaperone [Cantharellus anzutake]|uniref:HSP20-like chaperone n=1 Tax=Cantharellus anzutake TaxID=1750568 RepID=UPI00190635A1|nr:HSP20-like chaperone [Cantharellus anzutake]KAF8334091.1 HSP20-like chaperone [Cantharellus anzutake]